MTTPCLPACPALPRGVRERSAKGKRRDGTISAVQAPTRAEIRKFGSSLMTLSVILWITYATALGNNGKKHYLPRWALYLAWAGLIVGIAVVAGTILWPSRESRERDKG